MTEPTSEFEVQLTKLVNGGIRNAIQHHGPIDKSLIGSATKRVVGSISGYLGNQALKHADQLTQDRISALRKQIQQLERRKSELLARAICYGNALRDIRDGETVDPAETAKIAIKSKGRVTDA